MKLLVLTEDDDTVTHLSIGVDKVAQHMVEYFDNVIGLRVGVFHITAPVKIDEQETIRANYLMKEWRENGSPIMVVK